MELQGADIYENRAVAMQMGFCICVAIALFVFFINILAIFTDYYYNILMKRSVKIISIFCKLPWNNDSTEVSYGDCE